MDLNSRPNSVDSYNPYVTNNAFYHYSNAPTADPTAVYTTPTTAMTTQLATQLTTPLTPDYVNQYYAQYYREYYRRYYQLQRQQHNASSLLSSPQLRPPLKYGSRRCHAKAIFSNHDNQLLVVDNTSSSGRPVVAYGLQDLLIDYLFPKQFFHVLLRQSEGLPFCAVAKCLEWLRCRAESEINFEVKIILRVIQLLLKQNGVVSGLDLSELLFDCVDFSRMNAEFETGNEALANFRTLLVKGQLTLALNHALCPTHALFDHALALAYLTGGGNGADERSSEVMLKTLKRFNDTLHPNDPLHVFYNCLMNSKRAKRSAFETSFESFLILLSNDLDLNSINERSRDLPQLLALIKALRHKTTQDDTIDDTFLLSEDLFESDFDCLLVNECLEFARFSGQQFNRRLIEKKISFLSVLFDFGFVSNALQYCRQLSSTDLTEEQRRVVCRLESRFDPNLSLEETFAQMAVNDDFGDTHTTADDTYNEDNSLSFGEQNITQQSLETTPDDSPVINDRPIESLVSSEVSPVVVNPSFDYYGNVLTTNSATQQLSPHLSSTVVNSDYPQNDIPVLSSVPNGEPTTEFSFISSSMPLNDFQYDDSRRQLTTSEPKNSFYENTTEGQHETNNTDDTSSAVVDQKKTQNSGLFSKLFNFRPKNQAILPDDSKPTLIFDKTTNQWIDTSEGGVGGTPLASGPTGAPPPTLTSGLPQKKFEFKSRKRYIDITRKQ